ncbi:MAG: winged helix-turn-helix transcriptional regulator [Rhodothermales bacterium]
MNPRSHCPTNFALEHFGDKWSLLIIRDLMFKGKRHYNEFLEADEKVSTSVLGNRLQNLLENGLITRGKDPVKKSRIRYSLTQKGIDLLPLMVEMILWSGIYDKDTEAGEAFLVSATQNREALLAQLKAAVVAAHLEDA